jgi:asparagine synthase (glutamine-hydrolysing)
METPSKIVTGQGSDEILGGYSFFLPDFLREPDLTFFGYTLSGSSREKALRAAEESAPMFTLTKPAELHTSPFARRQLNKTTATSMMVTSAPPLPFAPWVLEVVGDCDPELTFTDNVNGVTMSKMQTKWHPLHTSEYLFTTATLPNILLGHLGDRGEMAHSIEGRTPFLDHKLTEYVNGLPPTMKIRQDPNHPDTFLEKWALKEAAKPFVTEEIYERKKHPYSAPVVYPVGGPIHQMIRRIVTGENVAGLGFLKAEGIVDEVERCFREQDRVGMRSVFVVAQFVVLGRMFAVDTAKPKEW